MRTFLAVCIALLVGLVIGAWPYKRDLRLARDEISQLKAQSERRQRSRSNMDGITRLLAIPEREAPLQSSSVSASQTVARPASPLVRESNATPSRVNARWRRQGAERASSAEEFRQQIRNAAELWKTRVSLARESFASRVPTNEAQVIRFDVLMEAMNIRLEATIEKWVDAIQTQEVVTAETGVRMMNELTDALVITYDELDRNMPADWREKAGSEFQLIDFVDPEVALPLAEIAPKFESQRPFGQRSITNKPAFSSSPANR